MNQSTVQLRYIPSIRPWLITALLSSFLAGAMVVKVGGKAPDISLFDVLLVMVFGLFILRATLIPVLHDWKITLLAFAYIAAAIVSLVLNSITNARDAIHSMASLKGFTCGYMVFVLVRSVMLTAADVDKIIKGLMWFGILLSGVFIYSFYRAWSDPGSVAVYGAWLDSDNPAAATARDVKNSTFFLGNIGAYWIEVIMPIIPLFCAYFANSRRKLLLLPLLFLFGLCLTASMSKGAIFALGIACCVALPRYWRHVFRWRVMVGLICIFIILYLAIPSDILQFNASILSALFERGDAKRLDLWSTAWNKFLENPFFGTGPGTIYIFNHSGGMEEAYTHNSLLNSLSDVGFLGTFPFGMMLLIILARAFRLPRTANGNALLVAVLATLIHGMVDPTFVGEEYYAVFWTIAAIVTAHAPPTSDAPRLSESYSVSLT